MKQPIAVWFTDGHLKEETIEINKSIYSQVLQICIDNNIPGVINGGDVFDSRKGQPESVLTTFSEILKTFQSSGINFVCIKGNHDASDYLSQESFLNAYEGREGFFLYKEYDYIDHSKTRLRFHLIPYFDEKLAYDEYLDKAIANCQLDYKNILFTHIAVSGVKNNDGSTVNNNLTLNRFQHFDKVLVGHYHNQQKIGTNIYYTGSCYQGNFGEDDKKGCTIIYDDGSTEFVKLQFPSYNTIIKRTPVQSIQVPIDGNNYRVKLKYKPEPSEIADLQLTGAKIIYDYETEVGDSIRETKTKFEAGDITSYFEQFCNEKEFDDLEYGLEQLNKN